MPDEESKKQAWSKIQDRDAHKLSRKEVEQVMAGFKETDQLDIVAKYNDDFFSTLPTMYKNTPYKLFKTYILSLMPRRGEIKDEMIQKLQAYLGSSTQEVPSHSSQPINSNKEFKSTSTTQTQSDNQYDAAFTKLIQENVEILQRQ